MVLGRCTADEAWAVLVNVSQHNNVMLRTVAEPLVATASGRRVPTRIRHAIGQVLRGCHRG